MRDAVQPRSYLSRPLFSTCWIKFTIRKYLFDIKTLDVVTCSIVYTIIFAQRLIQVRETTNQNGCATPWAESKYDMSACSSICVVAGGGRSVTCKRKFMTPSAPHTLHRFFSECKYIHWGRRLRMDFPLLTLVPLYYLYANAVLWDTVTLNFEKKIHKDTHEKRKLLIAFWNVKLM